MGDRRQDRRPQVADLGDPLGFGHVAFQRPGPHGRRELGRERRQHSALVGGKVAAAQDQHPVVLEIDRLVAAGGRRSPRRSRLRPPRSAVGVSTAAPSSPNVAVTCRTNVGSGSSAASDPASRASASASPRPRAASARDRSARSTSTLTAIATATKTRSASRFSGSAIVQVWIGGVKYQLRRSEAATALAMAGQIPPTAPIASTSVRKSSTSAVRPRDPRAALSAIVSSGSPTRASPNPAICREAGRPTPVDASVPPARRRGARDHDVDRAGTSDHSVDHRSPDQLGEPRPVALPQHHLRDVLGSGDLEERIGHVGADDLVERASECADQAPGRIERRASATPSSGMTWTASRSPLAAWPCARHVGSATRPHRDDP